MFFVYYKGSAGGCDHTIACNECLVKLPKSIVSMDEAIAHVMSEEDNSLSYFGGPEEIESAIIYEVNSHHKINMKKLLKQIEHEKAEEERKQDELDLLRLQKKLGK